MINRRVEPRIQLSLASCAEVFGRSRRLRNISVSGAFVEDRRPFPVGGMVDLVLWLRDNEPLGARAVIRHVEEGGGMGVEFTSLGDGAYERLRAYLSPLGE